MVANIYDNDFVVKLHEMKPIESKLFQPKIAGAPVIAGSAEAIAEDCILLTMEIREWEIERSIEFYTEQKQIEADEELVEKLVAQRVHVRIQEVLKTNPSIEIQENLLDESKELEKKMQTLAANYLAEMRNITNNSISNFIKSPGCSTLKYKMGAKDDASAAKMMFAALSRLGLKAGLRQHPGIVDSLSQLQSPVNTVLPVAASQQIFAIASDLHREIVQARLVFDEADDPATAAAAFKQRLNLQFAHRQQQIVTAEMQYEKNVLQAQQGVPSAPPYVENVPVAEVVTPSAPPYVEDVSVAKVVTPSAPPYVENVPVAEMVTPSAPPYVEEMPVAKVVTPSAPPYVEEIPVAEAVESSNAPYAEVFSIEPRPPQPGGSASAVEEDEAIWDLATDLDKEITRAGIAFNETDTPEVAQASFEARLNMRNAQQQMVIAAGETNAKANNAVSSFNENPVLAVAAAEQQRSPYQLPTPKPGPKSFN